jgi:hypothetical protein
MTMIFTATIITSLTVIITMIMAIVAVLIVKQN